MKRQMHEEATINLRSPTGIEQHRQARIARWRRVVIVALTLLGLSLLGIGLYMPAKAALAQHLLNRSWAAAQQGLAAQGGSAAAEGTVRPWPWADTWPVARLMLPSVPVPLTVLAGASGRNLAFAPGLLDGSALPGDPGVSVIAGHRDTHFRALERLAVGDRFSLERPDGAMFEYTVTALDVVDAAATALRLDARESVIALVTCWPFDAVSTGGPLRYVVTGRPVRRAASSASPTSTSPAPERRLMGAAVNRRTLPR